MKSLLALVPLVLLSGCSSGQTSQCHSVVTSDSMPAWADQTDVLDLEYVAGQ